MTEKLARPGSAERTHIVWLLLGTKAIRASVHSVRPATEKERLIADTLFPPLSKDLREVLPKRDFEDWSNEVPTATEVEEPAALPLHGPGATGVQEAEDTPVTSWDYPEAPMDRTQFDKVRERFAGGKPLSPPDTEGQGRLVSKRLRSKSSPPEPLASEPTSTVATGATEDSSALEGAPEEVLDEQSGDSSGSASARNRSNRAGAEALARHLAAKRAAKRLPTVSEETSREVRPRLEDATFDEDVGNDGQTVDFFTSHAWSDESDKKRPALQTCNIMDFYHAAKEVDDDCVMLSMDVGEDDLQAMVEDPNLFLIKKLRSTEVSVSKLSEVDRDLFDEAKAREVAEFLNETVVRRCLDSDELTESLRSGRLMRCRWVLTWKVIPENEQAAARQKRASEVAEGTTIQEDGSRKAKARIVLIGFQHPDLASDRLKTSSPVISHAAKTLILLQAAVRRWKIESIDAVSAFLQSDASEESNRLWCTGVGELARAVGALKPADAIRILKTFYGFTTGPRVFWVDSKGKLESVAGAIPILGDQCAWIFWDVELQDVIGICGSHVDDFLMAGDPLCPKWQKKRTLIREIYKWGAVCETGFRFAGINYTQLQDSSIVSDQNHYVDGIQDVPIEESRLRNPELTLTANEVAICRNKLGELHWLAVSSMPLICARVGLLLSAATKPEASMTVPQKIQDLIHEIRSSSLKELVIPNFAAPGSSWKNLVFVAFPDAALHNRPSGDSTGGYIILAAPQEVHSGELVDMAPIIWRSWKLERKAVATNDVEVQAMHLTEDALFRVRLLWSELNGLGVPFPFDFVKRVEVCSASVEGILATDSKGGYDSVEKNESPNLGLSNAKAAIQSFSLKQSLMETTLSLKWLAGDWNLGDALTKELAECRRSLSKFLQLRKWRLRFDPSFIVAAKKSGKHATKVVQDEVDAEARLAQFVLPSNREDPVQQARVAYLQETRRRV